MCGLAFLVNVGRPLFGGVVRFLREVFPIQATASPALLASKFRLRIVLSRYARYASHRYATMYNGPGYHHRQPILAAKICSLLSSLNPSTYDEIAPKIEYWIEYVITEEFMTIGDLVERVSSVAWANGHHSEILRFLKGFRDTPNRSERTRSFVDQLCTNVLRWFAVAGAEDLPTCSNDPSVTNGGWSGFARAASFVGHLIECGLLSHDLVRRHLIKPLITHHRYDHYRARAIYELFVVAGNTLLRGLLEPGDVQVCFERLDTLGNILLQYPSRSTENEVFFQILATLGGIAELYTARLNVRSDSCLNALHCDLTYPPGISRDPYYVVAAQGGGRAKGCRGSWRGGWGGS